MKQPTDYLYPVDVFRVGDKVRLPGVGECIITGETYSLAGDELAYTYPQPLAEYETATHKAIHSRITRLRVWLIQFEDWWRALPKVELELELRLVGFKRLA